MSTERIFMNDNCKEFLPLINDFIDDNLISEDLEKLENHLKSCNECSSELSDFKATTKLVKSLKEISPSAVDEAFSTNIINQIKKEQTTTSILKSSFLKYAATIVVIFLSALIAMNINTNKKSYISTETNLHKEYITDINSIFLEQDASHLAEAGLPTDENGFLDINGL